MADNPEFAAKLADALAERLGNKLRDAGFDLSGIEQSLDTIQDTLKNHDRRFDTLDHNFETLGEKLQLHDGEFRKGQRSSRQKIDGHLGINTDTRKRA